MLLCGLAWIQLKKSHVKLSSHHQYFSQTRQLLNCRYLFVGEWEIFLWHVNFNKVKRNCQHNSEIDSTYNKAITAAYPQALIVFAKEKYLIWMPRRYKVENEKEKQRAKCRTKNNSLFIQYYGLFVEHSRLSLN